MSYVADIIVPKERGLTIVCTGDAAMTQEECLARACYTAGVYYVKDIGYPFAEVQLHEVCDACRGAGRVAGKRRMSWKPCKACKERGNWPVGEKTRIETPAEEGE